ncbi:MAG: hypothetical protein MI861_07910, partial [Pirellulales bacterium]|nr:hypothetical protein [Pirellulales bacterium]
MNALITPHDVVLRFARVRRAILTHRLLSALLCGVCVFTGLLIGCASVDFYWELPAAAGLGGLAGCLLAAVATAGVLANNALKYGSSRRAAAELEHRFESIGQRLRTTLDLAGRSGADQLPLSVALATQTQQECDAVDLESVVPRKQTLFSLLAVAALLAALWLPSVFSPYWTTAVIRSLGFYRPYTAFEVVPGDLRVDEGTPVETKLTMTGRTNRQVQLFVRPDEQDAQWQEVKVRRGKLDGDSTSQAVFLGVLGQIHKPMEYRFTTSAGSTPIHRIDVRYPVRIEAIELSVRRPQYTGLEDRVFQKTDVTVLEGSQVECRIRAQRPIQTVSMTLVPSQSDSGEARQISGQKIGDGTQWRFQFTASENARWWMSGSDASGTPMDPVRGQVRVKEDRPPKLRWNSPSESLFVHTLAEVPMSVRVEDDYGLSEAAIRFEISGNDGYTLAEFDLTADQQGQPPTARQVLENVLPLEHFPLTEKDYIAYYAYAIDNHPDHPHRVESERRYIDVRQLKIDVLLRDDDDNDGDGANRNALATLDELISRQRYLINRTRTLQLMDSEELSDKLRLLDRHVERQGDLASLTRLVAERLQERGNDNLDAMFQAEASMIQAADSLTLADFEAALPQQEDAQRFLVEARTELERVLGSGNRRSLSGDPQNLLRMVRQRLRRRGGDEGNQNAQRDLVARIRAVASQQMSIVRELTRSETSRDAADSV